MPCPALPLPSHHALPYPCPPTMPSYYLSPALVLLSYPCPPPTHPALPYPCPPRTHHAQCCEDFMVGRKVRLRLAEQQGCTTPTTPRGQGPGRRGGPQKGGNCACGPVQHSKQV